MRYAFDDKGEELELLDFLKVIEKKRTTLDALNALKFETKSDEFDGLIPCIKNRIDGHTTGYGTTLCFIQVCSYARSIQTTGKRS